MSITKTVITLPGSSTVTNIIVGPGYIYTAEDVFYIYNLSGSTATNRNYLLQYRSASECNFFALSQNNNVFDLYRTYGGGKNPPTFFWGDAFSNSGVQYSSYQFNNNNDAIIPVSNSRILYLNNNTTMLSSWILDINLNSVNPKSQQLNFITEYSKYYYNYNLRHMITSYILNTNTYIFITSGSSIDVYLLDNKNFMLPYVINYITGLTNALNLHINGTRLYIIQGTTGSMSIIYYDISTISSSFTASNSNPYGTITFQNPTTFCSDSNNNLIVLDQGIVYFCNSNNPSTTTTTIAPTTIAIPTLTSISYSNNCIWTTITGAGNNFYSSVIFTQNSNSLYILSGFTRSFISQTINSNGVLPTTDYSFYYLNDFSTYGAPSGLISWNNQLYVAHANHIDIVSNFVPLNNSSNPSTFTTVQSSWSILNQNGNFGLNTALTTDGTYLYGTLTNGRIAQIEISSGTANCLWANIIYPGTGLAILNGYLYVMDSNGFIQQINTSNPTQINNNLLGNPVSGGCALCFYGNYLFFGYQSGTTINIGVALVTSNNVVAVNNTFYSYSATLAPNGLSIFGNYLYIATYDGTSANVIQLLLNDTGPITTTTTGPITTTTTGPITATTTGPITTTTVPITTTTTVPITTIAPLPFPICFLKGTYIYTKRRYELIETLKKGDLVNTLKDNYVPIDSIIKETMYHDATQVRNKSQLFHLSFPNYQPLLKDLYLTGGHSVLVAKLTDAQQNAIMEEYKDIYVTDQFYRLPVYLDKDASVHLISGTYTIYHLVLENTNIRMNYGIYANGLLVESLSKIDSLERIY